jgi:hypothetical protein
VTAAAGAHDQPLVVYHAALMFMSFLVGLLSIAGLARPGMPTQIIRHEPDRSDRRRVHPHRAARQALGIAEHSAHYDHDAWLGLERAVVLGSRALASTATERA